MEIEEDPSLSTSSATTTETTTSAATNASRQSTCVNEDPYYYVATIYKGTVITHSVVGNFLFPDKKSLIVS